MTMCDTCFIINNQARMTKSKTSACGQVVIDETGFGLCEEKMVEFPDSPGSKEIKA